MSALHQFGFTPPLAEVADVLRWAFGVWPYLAGAFGALVVFWLCFRYVPHNKVGVVEKLWSLSG